MKSKLTHIDKCGNARMVDVNRKEITRRIAKASCRITMKPATLKLIQQDRIAKGNVYTVSKVAGILAAKKTAELIPMCHSISLEHVEISFSSVLTKGIVDVHAEVITSAKTGAEMEALQAVAVAALTIYDMCKAVDREMIISDIKLLEKSGGKSGKWTRK